MLFSVEKVNFMTSTQKFQGLETDREFWEYVEKKCG